MAAFFLLLYVSALAFVLLIPDSGTPATLLTRTSGTARSVGVPEAFLVPYRWEFFANVLIVVPATILASVVWRTRDWTFWTAYGFVGSLGVETVQAFLPGRSATYVDVVANTLGALTGAVIVGLLRRLWASS